MKGVCPRWLSRPCLALSATGLLLFCLIVAIATPWYQIIIQNTPALQGRGDELHVFHYAGLFITVEPDYADPSTNTYPWSEMNASQTQSVYQTSLILLIIALLITGVLGPAIYVCMIMKSTSMIGYRITCGSGFKWVALLMALLAFVFVLLGWTLFFRFNQALKQGNSSSFPLCPTYTVNGTAGSNLYWCSSFSGRVTAVGDYFTKYTWGPSVGWIFAVACTPCVLLAAFCLLISSKRPVYADEYEDLDSDNELS